MTHKEIHGIKSKTNITLKNTAGRTGHDISLGLKFPSYYIKNEWFKCYSISNNQDK
jgi:hypothetical protein